VKDVAPDKKLEVDDMCVVLRHYFTLAEEVLEDENVQAMLTHCCGRPHTFVNVVFKPLFDRLRGLENKVDFVDALLLCGDWRKAAGDIQRTYQQIFHGLLYSSPKVIPHDSDGTTKSLVPLLLSALLSHKGIMTLPNDEVVAEAVRCSIVPVTSSVGDKRVDLTQEPIVEAALWTVLLQITEGNMELVMRLLLCGVRCQDKGITAETAFSYYLVVCSAVNIKKARHNSLSGLLTPFFEKSTQQQPPLLLNNYRSPRLLTWRNGRRMTGAFCGDS
jgi:hypothetical protein